MAGACPAHRQADVPRPAPAEPCRHGRSWPAPTTAWLHTPENTLSIILSPDPAGSAHPDKAGRSHAHAAPHHCGEG
jgi:hypothetical protein